MAPRVGESGAGGFRKPLFLLNSENKNNYLLTALSNGLSLQLPSIPSLKPGDV
jgi:hypothetical protein